MLSRRLACTLSTQELNIYKGIADQFGKSELRSTTMGQLLIIKVLYQAIVSTKIMRSSSFLQYYCMLYNLQSIKIKLWIQLIEKLLKRKSRCCYRQAGHVRRRAIRMQDRIVVQRTINDTLILITIL